LRCSLGERSVGWVGEVVFTGRHEGSRDSIEFAAPFWHLGLAGSVGLPRRHGGTEVSCGRMRTVVPFRDSSLWELRVPRRSKHLRASVSPWYHFKATTHHEGAKGAVNSNESRLPSCPRGEPDETKSPPGATSRSCPSPSRARDQSPRADTARPSPDQNPSASQSPAGTM